MVPKVLRNGIMALCAVVLTSAPLPDAALARGGYYAGFRGNAFGHRPAYVAFAVGQGGYCGYPLDDTCDYPYGYGEYAEYGPWAHRGYAGCQLTQRRVWTGYGLRWRTLRICN